MRPQQLSQRDSLKRAAAVRAVTGVEVGMVARTEQRVDGRKRGDARAAAQ
jgi:hypothetical protein